jgi:hypothetical protein
VDNHLRLSERHPRTLDAHLRVWVERLEGGWDDLQG